jgi:hypothetical protein
MSYRLRVSVATIGIRGTDFSVVMCQRDCRDSDGGLAAKGLYGEVLEGRIAVTPLDDRLLEREFRAGEFFHLADEHSAPTPLFLPPPFLRSKADEQARFMERTGIAIAPGSPGAAPGLSGVVGGTTNGLLTGDPAVGLTGTPTNGLAGTVTSLAGVTSPVAASIGSAVSTVTSPIVSLLAPTVPAVTPVVTSIAAPVVSTVTPVVIPIAAPAPSVTIPGTIPTTLPIGLRGR